jgi:hypothetical protein
MDLHAEMRRLLAVQNQLDGLIDLRNREHRAPGRDSAGARDDLRLTSDARFRRPLQFRDLKLQIFNLALALLVFDRRPRVKAVERFGNDGGEGVVAHRPFGYACASRRS